MASPKQARLTALIGDVIRSKEHTDRTQLQRSLRRVLDRANMALRPAQTLELAVGDEFQGAFADPASATYASLWLRLALLVEENGTDSRYGLGHGTVIMFDLARTPKSQDGPGWWSARAAIDRAKILAASPRTSFTRTCFGYWPSDHPSTGTDAGAIESFLFCRDSIVNQMSVRQRRLLWGHLHRYSQAQLATKEGISQGAVSQSLHSSGALAIDAAQARLQEKPA